jgi:hypothetical protein
LLHWKSIHLNDYFKLVLRQQLVEVGLKIPPADVSLVLKRPLSVMQALAIAMHLVGWIPSVETHRESRVIYKSVNAWIDDGSGSVDTLENPTNSNPDTLTTVPCFNESIVTHIGHWVALPPGSEEP